MKKITAILLGIFISASGIPGHLSYAADQKTAYEILSFSSDGLRVAMDTTSGLLGYVDEEGKTMTPFIYASAGELTNGLAQVYNEAGESFVINNKGEVVIKFKKELGNIGYFVDYGIASLPTGQVDPPEKYALLDQNGNLITGYDYDIISRPSYYDNISGKRHFYGPIIAIKNGKSGILDTTGKVVVPFEYDMIQASASGEYNIFAVSKKIGNAYKYGYINGTGKVLAHCVYDGAGDFAEGYSIMEKGGKYAVVNSNGTLITDFIYDGMYPYKEGLAPVQIKGLWGCIDTNGNLVIPCQYDSMGFSVNGNINFYLQDGKTEVKLKNPVISQRPINIYLNGKWMYTDQTPVIKNGRTLAPLRAVAEALGYGVEWDSAAKSIVLQNSKKIIRLAIGSDEAVINILDDGKDSETILLDTSAMIESGRTLVPVRFLAENIGAEVTWDPDTKTINIKN